MEKRRYTKSYYKLIGSLVFLMAAIAVSVSLVFAWFTARNTPGMDSVDIDVVGENNEIGIELSLYESGGHVADQLLPGDYLCYELKLTNKSSAAQRFQLQIARSSVVYPTAQEGFIYQDKYIFSQDYFAEDGSRTDVSDLFVYSVSGDGLTGDALSQWKAEYQAARAAYYQEMFRRFVAPVSNAVGMAIYTREQVDAGNLGTTENPFPPSKITSGIKASEQALASKDGFVYVNAQDESQSPVTVPYPDGADCVFELPAGTELLTAYLVVWFDPALYESASVDRPGAEQRTLLLKNSNPYLNQSASFQLKALAETV